MNISELELFHIKVPFIKPYTLSKVYGTLTHAEAVILKLTTTAGVTGFGEADPMNPFTEETPATVMAVVRDQIWPHLSGQDPIAINRIEARLDAAVHGHLLARGAVNMALYDILGKVHDTPAYTFLGGRLHERLPLLGPIGNGSSEEDAEAIEDLINQGYRTVMIKMGSRPIVEEIERMNSASERFGGRLKLIADANQGWRFKQALTFISGIRGFEPDLLEQPLERNDMEGMKRLRRRFPGMLSADEALMSGDDAVRLIRNQAVDAFSIKVSKNGGLTKAWRIAQMAAGFRMQCLMNSMLEFGISQAASLQLGCTLDNLIDCGHAYMSVLRLADDVTDFGRHIENATVTVPDSPGLGIQVDAEKLQKYTQNHLRLS